MSYVNKKFIFNWLTSSSLLLAGVGSVHGARQAINIVPNEGPTIKVTRKQIIANIRFQVEGDENKAHIQIGSIHIDVDRSKLLDHFKLLGQLIRSIRATPGVKSAILVMFSPNERCENTIREFSKIFHSGLSFSEQIKLNSKLCSSLLKYGEQDSELAKENLPTVQNNLGVALANSAQGSTEEISLLKRAVELLTQSADAGCQQAKENLPIVQNNLGVVLANSAQGSGEEISLLWEAVKLLTQSADAGCQLAQRNLPIEKYKLGVVLANSARGSADKIPLLKESIRLLTESVNAGDPYAKNLPLIHATLEKINQRLESLTADVI